jgi:uncharacterized protein YndB with AHSA1/START domain
MKEQAGHGAQERAVVRQGERELAITWSFNAPPSAVYAAWSQSELFQRWWMPKSMVGISLVACDLDVRTGGKYRLEFGVGGSETMAFFGKYLDVVPNERIVWTNDEGEEGAITTVSFARVEGATRLTFHELYPTADALQEALDGSAAGLPEQLQQLEALLSAA